MELDLRLELSVAISALLMAVVLHFQARSFPQTIQGIRHWSRTLALASLGILVNTSEGPLPEVLRAVLAPILVHGALLMMYDGTCVFTQSPRHYQRLIPLVVLSVLAQSYFQLVDSILWMQVTLRSFTNLALMAPTLYLLVRKPQGKGGLRFSKVYTATIVACLSLVWLTRGSWALVMRPLEPLIVPERIYQYFALLYPSLVVAAATGLILMAFDRLKDELEYLVSHDALTGAYSRRGFMNLAEIEISRALRMQRDTALMVLDLDHFKQVNDRFGHPVGDQVLRKFTDIARLCLRREDLLGRFGGEEFMVLLPDTSPAASLVVAERIRSAVLATRVAAGQQQVRFTVSIGVANAAGRGTLEDMLKLADRAMYLAKSRGRNRVEVA